MGNYFHKTQHVILHLVRQTRPDPSLSSDVTSYNRYLGLLNSSKPLRVLHLVHMLEAEEDVTRLNLNQHINGSNLDLASLQQYYQDQADLAAILIGNCWIHLVPTGRIWKILTTFGKY